jgi:ketosteroid isomerase-like protein
MNRRHVIVGCVAAAIGWDRAARAGGQTDSRGLERAVGDAERAFAGTMARRDLSAFESYLSEEAVFLGNEGNVRVLRGRQAIVDAWKTFFQGPTPPFSWAPDLVEVIASGTLALTSGPVRDPAGAVTGRFNSVWRLESDGRWRVVFDRGSNVCPSR